MFKRPLGGLNCGEENVARRATSAARDGRTGTHVWASRYDHELADIFALQDEITYHVVAALVPEIERAEARHVAAKPPASMDAWDFYLRRLVAREPGLAQAQRAGARDAQARDRNRSR